MFRGSKKSKNRWEKTTEFDRIQERNERYEQQQQLNKEQRSNQLASRRGLDKPPAVAEGWTIPEQLPKEVTIDTNGNVDPRQAPLPPEDTDEAMMDQALNHEDSMMNRIDENLTGRSLLNLPWKAHLKNRKLMKNLY